MFSRSHSFLDIRSDISCHSLKKKKLLRVDRLRETLKKSVVANRPADINADNVGAMVVRDAIARVAWVLSAAHRRL